MNHPKFMTHRPSTQRKMEDILEAAKAEFLACGFASASIEAIAARAGVSKVTIYNHYGDKENLFGETLRSYIAKMQENFQIENLEQKSLRDILIGAGVDMLGFLTEDKMIRFERMLGAEVNRDPKIGSYFLEKCPRSLLASLTELLKAAVERGEIQSDDLTYSAEIFPSLIMGRLELMMRYGWEPDLTSGSIRLRVQKAVDSWMKIHKI